MRDYEACTEVGLRGMFILTEYAQMKYPGLQLVNLGQQKHMQMLYGDFLAKFPNDRHVAVEVKTDQKASTTGNLFLEVWSNRHCGRYGWLYTFQSTALWYYLIDTDELLVFDGGKLREWASRQLGPTPFMQHRVKTFPYVEQQDTDQPNDAWGRLVPIEVAIRLGLVAHRSHPRAFLEADVTEQVV